MSSAGLVQTTKNPIREVGRYFIRNHLIFLIGPSFAKRGPYAMPLEYAVSVLINQIPSLPFQWWRNATV